MASFKTTAFVYLLVFWTYLSALFSKIPKNVSNFYYYVKDYFHGHNDTWLFVPGHTAPMPISNIFNDIRYNWVYDNPRRTLHFIDNVATNASVQMNATNTREHKLSWLSTKLRVTSATNQDETFTYDLDEFISELTIVTVPDNIPTLSQIFMCWCAYSRNWFNMNDNVEFVIFNELGEEVTLPLKDYNNNILRARRNKLYVHNISSIILNEPTTPLEVSPLLSTGENKDKDA
jgi:hypothetical protein